MGIAEQVLASGDGPGGAVLTAYFLSASKRLPFFPSSGANEGHLLMPRPEIIKIRAIGWVTFFYI